MNFEEVYSWLKQSERRLALMQHLMQPVTATQLARRMGIAAPTCTYLLWELSLYEVVVCLNSSARRSRLYWLTNLGRRCQRRARQDAALPPLTHDFPCVNWDLYGWTCFNHRSAIVRALTEPIQPAEIKRRLRIHDAAIRISANNIRDIVRLFRERGIVFPVRTRKKAHARYELTDEGKKLQVLLNRAQSAW